MSTAEEMCNVFREASKVCDQGTFKYPYISGARIRYKTLSVCDSPYKVLNARKLLEKGTRCCAAINKAIAGYQTAKGQGVFDGGNSDVDVKGANQNEAMTKSKALTMLADGLAALVDCELNVKSNRVEVLDTWRRKWQATASSLPPGSDSVVELEDLDVAMLGDLVGSAVICYYTKQCDLIGQLFVDYAEKNFKLLATKAKGLLIQEMDTTIGAVLAPVTALTDTIRDMADPHAQWIAALGNLDPTTTAYPSLSTTEWWTKHCTWLAKDAQHNCFVIDQFSYGCEVTNCPHPECLCRGFAGDGSLPPAPESDAAHVHALVTAFNKIYRLQPQVMNAQAVLSTLMKRRNVMVKQSSSGDNATGVGQLWNNLLGSNGLNMLEILSTAERFIDIIQRFPALLRSFQELPSLVPTLLHAAEAARDAADLLSAAGSAATTLQNCQSLDPSSCFLDELWTNVGQHASTIPYDGHHLDLTRAAQPSMPLHGQSPTPQLLLNRTILTTTARQLLP